MNTKKHFTVLAVALLASAMLTACTPDAEDYEPYESASYEAYAEEQAYEAYAEEQTYAYNVEDYEPYNIEDYEPYEPATHEAYVDIPFMWLVTSPSGQTMYMFGSIHAATHDLYPLSPIIMDAFRRSDYLMREGAGPESYSFADFMLADGRTITDYIPSELHQRAMSVVKEYENHFPRQLVASVEELDNYHPYIWWSVLTRMAADKSRLSFEAGLDAFFMRQAVRNNMEILWAEYPSGYVEPAINMSLALHLQFLENSLDISGGAESLERLYGMWRRGDDQGLLDEFYRSLEAFGCAELAMEFRDAALTRRDLQMAGRAQYFMAEGKNVFFVAGAYHMLVENGIIDLLVQRGYSVERIQ